MFTSPYPQGRNKQERLGEPIRVLSQKVMSTFEKTERVLDAATTETSKRVHGAHRFSYNRITVDVLCPFTKRRFHRDE